MDNNFNIDINDERVKQVHEDVTKFIKDLQAAQEATRKHNTHFGPGPSIKTITTTKEQMDEVVKNANIVVSQIPPWIDTRIKDDPLCIAILKNIEEKEILRLENESLKEQIRLLQDKYNK